jgi:sigma-E factor negative regulatory protein RseB
VAALAGSAAQPPAAAASAGTEPWLQRIQQAAASISYQGTLASSAGGAYSSSRVLHYCDGRQTYERLELLDGENRLQYRHNDQVVTVWPSSRRAVVEHRDPVTQFPALPVATAARVLENYELQKVGQERVAGLEAEVLLLQPRDRLRFPQRLGAHRDTGLLLRNDVLAPGGEVLESSAFVDVRLGGKPLEADRTYKVAGWAPVSEEAKTAGSKPIWDLVEPWLKSKGTISPRKLNLPALTGVKGNPGAA